MEPSRYSLLHRFVVSGDTSPDTYEKHMRSIVSGDMSLYQKRTAIDLYDIVIAAKFLHETPVVYDFYDQFIRGGTQQICEVRDRGVELAYDYYDNEAVIDMIHRLVRIYTAFSEFE